MSTKYSKISTSTLSIDTSNFVSFVSKQNIFVSKQHYEERKKIKL